MECVIDRSESGSGIIHAPCGKLENFLSNTDFMHNLGEASLRFLVWDFRCPVEGDLPVSGRKGRS